MTLDIYFVKVFIVTNDHMTVMGSGSNEDITNIVVC